MVSGWRFWPEREPGPVDDAYVQARWVRPYLPGPFRVLLTAVITGFAMFTSFAGFLAVFAEPTVGRRLIVALITLVLGGSLAILGSRLLSSGVWVNDFGVRVLSITGSEIINWESVADVRRVQGRPRLLGSPVRRSGEGVWLVLKDGSDRETPLSDRGPDFLARPEAFDMAAGAVERWFEGNRSP